VTRYKQRYDGEGFVVPLNKVYRLGCCDCGLVHEMDFRIYKKLGDAQMVEQSSEDYLVSITPRRLHE
jgi:hypothetical protein